LARRTAGSNLCHVNPDETSGLFLEILVDEAANCAAVELDLIPHA